jgi:regulatory protein
MQPKKRWKGLSANSSESSAPEFPSEDSFLQLYNIALKNLGRRSYSIHELRTKLLLATEDRSVVSAVIEKLKANGYLDDRKAAESLVRSRQQWQRQGRMRIVMDLARRGFDQAVVRNVLDDLMPESEETNNLNQAIDRQLKGRPAPNDAKSVARLYNHLRRKGFSGETIRQELNRRFSLPDDD